MLLWWIGHTPGHLSSAIKWHASKGARPEWSRYVVHSLFATSASERHRSSEADLKAQHNLLQLWASTPDGPAAPSVCFAAVLTRSDVRPSNRTGWTASRLFWLIKASSAAGRPVGCLLSSHPVAHLLQWGRNPLHPAPTHLSSEQLYGSTTFSIKH